MVPAISRQGEDLIRQVTDYTASLTDDGMTPTAALVKAARELQLPKGHISLAARVYNVAAAEAHRKSAEDLETRVSDFPTADPEKAEEELYPTEVLSPADKEAAIVVSPHYSRAPRGPADTLKKEALWAMIVPEKQAHAPAQPADPTTEWNVVSSVRGITKAAEREMRDLFERVVTDLNVIRVHMGKHASDSMEVVAEYAAHRHGETGKTLAGLIGHKFQPARMKRAHAMEEASSRVRKMVDQLADDSEMYAVTRQALAVCSQKSAAVTADFWSPVLGPPPVDAFGFRIPEDHSVNFPKRANLVPLIAGSVGTTLARDLSSRLPAGRSIEKLEDKMYRKLTDPLHEQEIRNAQSTAMLSDFMANDPIISGYDADEVIQRYNGLAQLMPHGVSRGELMRSALRKSLASGGNLDPFDIGELIKMDLALKSVDNQTYSPQTQTQGAPSAPPML